MQKVRIALIGAGQRGKDVYGEYAINFPQDLEFVAVAEPNPIKREQFATAHGLAPHQCFERWEDMLSQETITDALNAVVIATPDHLHYAPTRAALEKGCHVLLEKPMSNDPWECYDLGEIAKANDRIFMICHVLRYTPFFNKIKDLIDTGAIGKVMTIQHNENIGYYHMAHSFVRGNWRNTQESSPIILAKSCHDMDILHYLVGYKCSHVSSFGQLSHFCSENAPEGASHRCLSCQHETTCLYSAKAQYLTCLGGWPSTVVTEVQTENNVLSALENGPYGRCVYACDNDVCDHQVTTMKFENGVTATFNLTAFTNDVHRTLKIMGTLGEIRADDSKNEVSIQRFGTAKPEVFYPEVVSGGHGGGDHQMMIDFLGLIQHGQGSALTSADKSVHSHIMSFAAEASRLNGQTIEIKDFMTRLSAQRQKPRPQ